MVQKASNGSKALRVTQEIVKVDIDSITIDEYADAPRQTILKKKISQVTLSPSLKVQKKSQFF